MSTNGVVQWLWGSAPSAAVVRGPLIPFSLVYSATMRLRAHAYRRGWLTSQRLSLPTVAVGNLSVGGTGKTPLAAWIAQRYAARGRKPGILLRGYGDDEPLVHRRLVPDAVVVAHPDRATGARQAIAAGARVLVLDDAFQLLRVARDLNIAIISAESAAAAPWTLPAGPWREDRGALARADWLVVTRKHATAQTAQVIAEQLAARHPGRPVSVAHLALAHLERLRSGSRELMEVLKGRRVLAAAGIADPRSFAAQLQAFGAEVHLAAFRDHHTFTRADVQQLMRASGQADYVVFTEKDAVKLRGAWPREAPEPLVAAQSVHWERNGRQLEQALDAVVEPPGGL